MTCCPHKVVLHLLILAALAASSNAQTAGLIGRKIVEIRYSPPRVLSPEDLEEVQVLKQGALLRAQDVSDAIDRLFATGRFEDIVAEAEPSGEGVIVRFVTTPAFFIGGVSVAGKVSESPNRGEVASTARLTLGSVFREEDVDRAVTRIKRLLTSNGLYEGEVTPEIDRSAYAEQVFVTFRINTGKRAKYGMPTIHGETKLSDGAILRATGWRVPLIHWWRHVTDVRTRRGVQGVLSKYQKQDRLSARVELEKLDYDAKRRRVHPQLNIEAGPKIRVKAVEAKVSKRVLRRYVPIFRGTRRRQRSACGRRAQPAGLLPEQGLLRCRCRFSYSSAGERRAGNRIRYRGRPALQTDKTGNHRESVFQRGRHSRAHVHGGRDLHEAARPLQ